MNPAGVPVLSDHEIDYARRRRADGISVEAIAGDLGCSRRTVYRLLAGRWRCQHCGAKFLYRRDLWTHVARPVSDRRAAQ
jgi:AraC-like DNA-binding protein